MKNIKNNRHFFSSIMLALCLIQSLFMSSVFIGSAFNDTHEKEELLSTAMPKDEGFYRVKSEDNSINVNMIGGLGFNSMAHYTSITDKDYYDTAKKLGYSAYWMEVSAAGGTAISDIIVSNKYTLDRDKGISRVHGDDIGLLVESGVLDNFKLNDKRTMNHNELYKAVTKEDGFTFYYPKYEKNGKLLYTVNIEEEETLYFDIFDGISTSVDDDINRSVCIYVNGEILMEAYPEKKDNGIKNLGTFENTEVMIEVEILKELDRDKIEIAGLKTADINKFKSHISHVDHIGDYDNLEFKAVLDTERDFFLSVPYYENMKIYVNGEEKQIEKVIGCFCKVQLEKGTNIVRASYIPKGLAPGIIISVFSCLFVLFTFILHRYVDKNKTQVTAGIFHPELPEKRIIKPNYLFKIYNCIQSISEKINKAAYRLLCWVFFCIVAVIYILPVAVYFL